MSLSDESGFPVGPVRQPMRELLLAQALDACIAAERRLPGSPQEIIATQPVWARAELNRLVGVAESLDAAPSNAVMSAEFRVAARARLMQRIGADTVGESPAHRPSTNTGRAEDESRTNGQAGSPRLSAVPVQEPGP